MRQVYEQPQAFQKKAQRACADIKLMHSFTCGGRSSHDSTLRSDTVIVDDRTGAVKSAEYCPNTGGGDRRRQLSE